MSKEIQVCSSEDHSTMEDNTIVLLAYFISDNCVNTLMNFYFKKSLQNKAKYFLGKDI